MRILFVCLGNICRSPTAEGVLRHRLQQAGLEGQIEVASAGLAAGMLASRQTSARNGPLCGGAMTCRSNEHNRFVRRISSAMT